MTTHTIQTTTGQNIGQSILNYLTNNQLKNKVEVLTIHTTKQPRSRVRITTLITKPKFK